MRILDTERQAARRRPVLGREVAGVLFGSRLTMKLMSPCRYSDDVLRAVARDQREAELLEEGSSVFGVGDANSTNSKPIRPIGLSNRSAMSVSNASRAIQPTRTSSRKSPRAGRSQRRPLEVGDLSSVNARTTLAGAPRMSDRSGNALPLGDDGAGADEPFAADHRAVHDHRLDADQRAVADRAAVHHRLVADRDARADDERKARIGMQHGAFLDVAFVADRDRLVVAARDRAEPDAGPLAERDPADQRGFGRDVGRSRDLGRLSRNGRGPWISGGEVSRARCSPF